MRYVLLIALIACGSKKVPLRPLATGTFGKYTIAVCAQGGHVVKLVSEPDERGEANNKHLVEKYRDRYLLPRLDEAVDVIGWTFDSSCGKSGLTLKVVEAGVGEALHRIGETLAKNPTDIEVTVVPGK